MSQKITLIEYAELKNSTINDIVKNAEAKGVCLSSDPSYILDDSTLKQIDPVFFHNRKYPQLKSTDTPHEPMVLGTIDTSSLNLTTCPTRKSKDKKISSISDALAAQLKDYAVKHQNERVVGKVDRVMPHGAYISLGDISGFLYTKDVAWGFVDDIHNYLLEGEKIEVIVVGFDEEKKK